MEKTLYRNTVEFAVRGRYALFSDILTRAGGEKSSYPIPTYEALKGILHSIYWKPTIVWIIDSVRIMNPIRTVRKGIRPIKYSRGPKEAPNDLAYYTYLEDVYYQVRAHFEWNMNRPELENDRNENKHHNIAKRMIERGGRRDIFLGTRECQGCVEPCVFNDKSIIGAYDNCGIIPYGLTYHGITYADEAVNDDDRDMMTVRLWRPVMENGVIDFVRPEDCTVKRHIRKMPVKPFGRNHNNFTGLDEFSGGDIVELE